MMRLGIGSYTFPWAVGIAGGPAPARPMTPADLLDAAGELGVRVVQIADNMPLDRMGEAEVSALAAHAERLGVQIEVGTRGICHDHLRTYLAIARRLGSPMLRTLLDSGEHRPSIDEAVELIGGMVGDFERANICLAIENHDRFRARELADLVRRLNSPAVGICLDTVNSLGAMEGPEIVLEELGPFVVNLHVKEFTIRRAPTMLGFIVEGAPAGQGRLNVPWLLGRLHSLGRECNAILEQWTPPAEDTERTIAREREWALSSVRYLRTLICR